MLVKLDRRTRNTAVHEPRPEFDRAGQPPPFTGISGQVARWSIGQQRCVPAAGLQVCYKRAVPVQLIDTNTHGGELKTVAEDATFVQSLSCLAKLARRRGWAIQYQSTVVVPYLGVAGHRLAIKSQVIQRRAE